MAQHAVIRGIPYPSDQELGEIMQDLQQRIQIDPNIAAAWNDDNQVRNLLGSYGLNEDVQTETLQSANKPAPASKCLLTCITTCWFTSCALTSFS